MKYLFLLFFGIALGAGGMWAGYNYHVVRTGEEFLFVGKASPTLRDLYADVRDWNARDWSDHAVLTKSMVDSGHGELVVKEAATGVLGDLFRLGGAALGAEGTSTR
ncbi:hypothetical protein [Stratiformator vulcanicus]|uniref:Uncharacterized protein n=1 Tax=Stratiformator vulcanicus TaxID=2527980 RepID=A0A517QXI5_9PLAN|nr:hypothetical protein [Stratiformator vulcanicus]QDT36298.1 hypothetical protein Pan189_06540 [Stratiformator vulcanicus]